MNEHTHQGQGGKPPPSNANGLPEGDRAHELMSLVLEHYIKHHEVVFKKLHIAQEATVKSLQELEKMAPGLQSKSGNTIDDIRKYEHMWGAIIEMFKAHGATEDDLERIEHVLLAIPRAIKQHYDAIIEQDKALQKLIASLNTDEYKKAVAIINEVQSRPNPMSGLGPEEYKPAPSAVHNAVPSYQFSVDMLRNRD
jgi:hypothetical protein